jgi:ATP-binding cassette subfamily B protein
MNCNRILVLDDGDVVDLGSHDELMERCEVYREISLSQMGGEVE